MLLLGRDNSFQEIDLGLVNSSVANSLMELILNRLRERDEVTESVGATKLVKPWPPFKEWTTKAARDAFFSSPSLPRLLKPEAIKRAIADAGKAAGGGYAPMIFEPDAGLVESDIEISDDMVLLKAEDTRLLKEPPRLTSVEVRPASVRLKPGESMMFTATGFDRHGRAMPVTDAEWSAAIGRIDQHGRYVATTVGDCQVVCRVGPLDATAEVRVAEEGGGKPPGGGGDDEREIIQGFRWKGSVPPQK